jgi:pre-mRNA-processing factor SLU7
VNPHIPEFLSEAPWWYDSEKAGLSHQRLVLEEKTSLDQWLKRGKSAVVAKPRTTFEVGACTNCGAKTHQAKDCLERPRKAGAWKTEKDLRPDDAVQPALKLTFAGVHDRYNGFDPADHMRMVRQFKEAQTPEPPAAAAAAAAGDAGGGGAEDQDAKKAKSAVLPSSLRVRDDTAKYLRNLAPDSAYYDPKTRSMRGNPTPHLPAEEVLFGGDNFVRHTGDANQLAQIELFARRQAQPEGEAKNAQANPTELERSHKEFLQRKDALRRAKKDAALERYGGSEHLGAPKVEATTAYTEWTKDGRLLRAPGAPAPSSKFAEDKFDSNHDAVWGSFFDVQTMAWGYACCWQSVRNCWCTGEAGRRALQESRRLMHVGGGSLESADSSSSSSKRAKLQG